LRFWFWLFKIKGKVVEGKMIAVTGTALGIGAAMAKLLKERGATVIGLDGNLAPENVDSHIPIDLADESSIVGA